MGISTKTVNFNPLDWQMTDSGYYCIIKISILLIIIVVVVVMAVTYSFWWSPTVILSTLCKHRTADCFCSEEYTLNQVRKNKRKNTG